MNSEELIQDCLQRIEELTAARAQFQANVHACDGAIQERRQLLASIESQDKTKIAIENREDN
jgi:hypothetical protein